MLEVRYSPTPIGLVSTRPYGDIYLHKAVVRETIEHPKEEEGYAVIVHSNSGRRWPVVVLWRGLDQMIFYYGYRLIQAAEDIPYDEREAARKLMLLRAEME